MLVGGWVKLVARHQEPLAPWTALAHQLTVVHLLPELRKGSLVMPPK
jgi:hypothetical protein